MSSKKIKIEPGGTSFSGGLQLNHQDSLPRALHLHLRRLDAGERNSGRQPRNRTEEASDEALTAGEILQRLDQANGRPSVSHLWNY